MLGCGWLAAGCLVLWTVRCLGRGRLLVVAACVVVVAGAVLAGCLLLSCLQVHTRFLAYFAKPVIPNGTDAAVP